MRSKIILMPGLITSSWHLKFVPGAIQPWRTNTLDAVERFGNAARLAQTYQGGAELADETLLALAGWLNKIGRPAKTLEVLPEARASQRQDLSLQYINALAGLQRWNEIKDLLMSERFPIEPMFQHVYLAAAQKQLGS